MWEAIGAGHFSAALMVLAHTDDKDVLRIRRYFQTQNRKRLFVVHRLKKTLSEPLIFGGDNQTLIMDVVGLLILAVHGGAIPGYAGWPRQSGKSLEATSAVYHYADPWETPDINGDRSFSDG